MHGEHETGEGIKRKFSKSHFNEIRDIKKYKAVTAKKRKASKSCFDEIRFTEKHGLLWYKSKKEVRDILIKSVAWKSMKLYGEKAKMYSHFNEIQGTKSMKLLR